MSAAQVISEASFLAELLVTVLIQAHQLWCPMSTEEMVFKTSPVCELLTTALLQTGEGLLFEGPCLDRSPGEENAAVHLACQLLLPMAR